MKILQQNTVYSSFKQTLIYKYLTLNKEQFSIFYLLKILKKKRIKKVHLFMIRAIRSN